MNIVKDLIDTPEQIAIRLARWFDQHRRDLPWRKGVSSYGVWVSEVMLQQTQVATCIPYYHRWMKAFPDIASLAKADEAQVMKLWEGLGYYSRARRLHQGAKQLYAMGQKELPKTSEELLSISGIGPYTAGAIMSFAWKKPTAAIDGNVIRVISRLFCIESLTSERATAAIIKEKVEAILGSKMWPHVMEALIELGALLCKKKPLCDACPVRDQCQGYNRGKAEHLPLTKARKPTIKLHRFVPVLYWQGQLALEKRGEGEIMQGLYEFPFFLFDGSLAHLKKVEQEFIREHGVYPIEQVRLKEITHHFTHHRATLYPLLIKVDKMHPSPYVFYSLSQIREFSLSSGHKKVWTQIKHLL